MRTVVMISAGLLVAAAGDLDRVAELAKDASEAAGRIRPPSRPCAAP